MAGSDSDLRLTEGVRRGQEIHFLFDGREVTAYRGESVAAALLAGGVRTLRHSESGGEPRGLFCGIGICFECRMVIDGRPNQRACMTPAAPGMKVESG